METKDHVCEMSIKRLHDARERGCEYSFLRYLEDLQERLEILDDAKLWEKYRGYLDEKMHTKQNS
jgi:hypothetical protein